MASLKHIVNKLKRKNSKNYIVFLVFILFITFAFAMTLRYYVFEPLRLNDSSMHPKFNEKEIIWVCKIKQCTDSLKSGDIVWIKLNNKEQMVRNLFALPGEKIKIFSNGTIKGKKKKFRFKDENVFIETRNVYIPKKGDTLYTKDLNDVELDYATNILKNQNMDFFIKTSISQGEQELSLDLIGASKLGNRQVSMQEINYLPWQDRYLLSIQIFQREFGSSPIKIKRHFYNSSDSSLIEKIIVQDDYYFTLAEKGIHFPDSRELGYFSREQIHGRYVMSPMKKLKKVKTLTKKLLLTE